MAPIKNGAKGNGSILNYFKSHIIPPNRWVNNETPADEIVVAPRRPAASSSTNAAGARSNSTPPKKRGRPAKSSSPASSVPRSSQSSNGSTASRKRGRPKKTESQAMRDAQLRSSSSPTTTAQRKPSTPQKAPSRYNISPLDGTPSITPTKDLPFRSPSCTPAKVRVASYVDISSSPSSGPSSSAIMADCAPPVSQKNIISPSKINNALSNTFGPQPVSTPAPAPPAASLPSLSSLTSLPPSSVLSGPTISSTASSRRVTTKGGLQGVRDSDSEDDGSSDDDLPPVTSFVKPLPSASAMPPNKRVRLSPPEQNTKPSTHISSLKYPSDKAKETSPLRPKFRKSIADIAAEQKRWRESRATVESLEKSVAQAIQQEEEQAEQAEDNATINSEMVYAMVGSDSDDQERMMKALKRTEALHDEQRYYFFLEDEPKTSSDTPFPGLPDEPWAKLYQTENSRSHACLSGLAAEMASEYPLPSQVTGWMMHQLCHEPNEALCEAYVEIIKLSSVHEGSVSATWGSLNSAYRTRSLFAVGTTDKSKSGLPPGLSYMIEAVSCLAPTIDNERPDAVPLVTCGAFTDLALMNVDEHVRTNTALKCEIAAAVQTMLDALSDELFGKLVTSAIEMFFSPSDLPSSARYQAICLLPAGTVRAETIRRRLALACFSTATDRKDAVPQDWAKVIQDRLESMPEFRVSAATDYRLLRDLTAVLDLAISGGWTEYAQLVTEQPVGTWGGLPPPSEAERLHNAQIDKICRRLELIGSKVLDSGTTHLRRTEAKTSIEQLVVRLEHSVRTRPRPKKGAFGFHHDDDDDEPVYQRRFKQVKFGKTGFVKEKTPASHATEAEISVPAAVAKVKTPTEKTISSPPMQAEAQSLVENAANDEPSDSELSELSSVDDDRFQTAVMDVDDQVEAAGSDRSISRPRYCYCNGVDDDRMIGCDGSTCERQWFHFRCLGIEQTPENEKWYCNECKLKEGVGSQA